MRRSGIRFRPPPIEIGPDLLWVLVRAFGPIGAALPRPESGREVLELARVFEVANRIGARQTVDRLSDELDSTTVSGFATDKRQSEFVTLQRRAALRDVTRAAASIGARVGLLKFIALDVADFLISGSREAVDIDILVDEERTLELQSCLSGNGYVTRDIPATEHHLPTLDHPTLGAVEVHTFVPGVCVSAGRAATLDSMDQAGLLSAVAVLPATCLVPDRRFLAAHALVHGIAQHGRHPDAYPSLRMMADLIDLGLADRIGRDDLSGIESWIESVVSDRECAAVKTLCRWLSEGAASGREVSLQGTDAGLVLQHIVAGTLDRHYRDALNLTFYTPGLSRRRGVSAFASVLKQALFPTRGQLDKIYGTRTSSAGYVMRRLFRPIALVGRVLRYTMSSVRVRLFRARK